MDPYRVLGVERRLTLAEIEARYRELLREWHPDLHREEDGEAVALAEARTRRLNAAMARLRREHRDPVRVGYAGPDASTWTTGPDGEDFGITVGWSDETDPEPPPTFEEPCPFCGVLFDDPDRFGLHLIAAHRVDRRYRARRRRRRRPWHRGPVHSTSERYLEVTAFVVCVAFIGLAIWFRAAVVGPPRPLIEPIAGSFVALTALAAFSRAVFRR